MARSMAAKPLSPAEIEMGKLLHLPVVGEGQTWPGTRGNCGEERPCPWARCKFHLLTSVNPDTGTLSFSHLPGPGEDWPEVLLRMPETCALDVADRFAIEGGATLEAIAQMLNITKARAQQIEDKSLLALRDAPELRDDLPPPKTPAPPPSPQVRAALRLVVTRPQALARMRALVAAEPGPYGYQLFVRVGGYGQGTGTLIKELVKEGLIRKRTVGVYERVPAEVTAPVEKEPDHG